MRSFVLLLTVCIWAVPAFALDVNVVDRQSRVNSTVKSLQQKVETFTNAVKTNATQITTNTQEIVVVKGIANDARTRAINAQTTASDARNRAINAQNTASDARNRAINAQSTANDARNRAINAQNRVGNYEYCAKYNKLYKPGTGCISMNPTCNCPSVGFDCSHDIPETCYTGNSTTCWQRKYSFLCTPAGWR